MVRTAYPCDVMNIKGMAYESPEGGDNRFDDASRYGAARAADMEMRPWRHHPTGRDRSLVLSCVQIRRGTVTRRSLTLSERRVRSHTIGFTFALSLTLVTSCGSSSGGVPKDLAADALDKNSAPAACQGDLGSATDLRDEPSPTVDQFRWRNELGCPVRIDVIAHFLGDDEHCDMDNVEILRVGTPVGERVTEEPRTFFWDPEDELDRGTDNETVTIDISDLPQTASDTTFRLGDASLWSDSRDPSSLYRVHAEEADVFTLDDTGFTDCA